MEQPWLTHKASLAQAEGAPREKEVQQPHRTPRDLLGLKRKSPKNDHRLGL